MNVVEAWPVRKTGRRELYSPRDGQKASGELPIISKASDPVPVKNRTLFFGDNLRVLREKFPGAEGYFDLVYLDPPFNSQQSYNVLFKEGLQDSPAQLHAFEDTWHWQPETFAQFNELVSDPRYPQKISDVMQGMEKVLGHNDVLAYLTMMAVRLVELHRVLKPSGSLYLHCDPTASHYLKVILDAVFGPKNFINEIIWKRAQPKAHATRRFSRAHDVILAYAKSDRCVFHPQFVAHDPEYIEKFYRHVEPETGRRFRLGDLTNPNKNRPNLTYEFPPGSGIVRVWRWTEDRMMEAWKQGIVVIPPGGGVASGKRYLDEMEGSPVTDLWDDIEHLHGTQNESLGYATQKPEALLERIIGAATDAGAWVLDPFGGCGTTAAAAEKLERNWIIIDVTTLAVNLVKRRLERMYPDRDLGMTVDGYPADLSGARQLFEADPFEFEYWCCDLVNARPAGDKRKGKMKGADRGIDGVITIVAVAGSKQHYKQVLVQVKGGHVSSANVRDFRGTIEREKALGGVFITMDSPSKAMEREATEAGTFTYELTGRRYPVLQFITVQQLLDGERPDLPNVITYAKDASTTHAVPEQGRLI